MAPGGSVGECLECNSEVDLAAVERLWCLFDAHEDSVDETAHAPASIALH